MKANRHKLILDTVLAVLIMTLYSKNVINLMYHEVAGLILCGFFVIHLVFNRKWISAVGKKLFSGKTNARAKATFLTDTLLLLSWTGVGVTGILISKTLFSFNMHSLKPVHYFCAAMGLILSGVHLGLHVDYIRNAVRKIPVMSRIRRPVSAVLTAAILIAGCISFADISIVKWLSDPFTQSAQTEGGPMSGKGQHGIEGSEESEWRDGGIPEMPDEAYSGTDTEEDAAGGQPGADDIQRNRSQSFSALKFLKLVVNVFSMLYTVMMVTYWIGLLLCRKKNKKALPSSV